MDILAEFTPETAREQDASVFASLALHDMHLTMIRSMDKEALLKLDTIFEPRSLKSHEKKTKMRKLG